MKIFKERWLQIALGGVLLFIITEVALVTTRNPLFFPTVILLGAFVVPVSFVAYFYEYVRDRDLSLPLLSTCFIVGGLVGVIAAGIIEYETLRNISIGSLFEVGFIEESVKLIFPAAMFIAWKYKHEADGLLFGVAAGMGFAALETMGYALSDLIKSGGSPSTLQQVLLVRGLLSPAGHAAWTGFICATLWRQRIVTGHWFGFPVVGAFLGAVVLHALWDIVSSMTVQTTSDLVLYIGFFVVLIVTSLSLVFWRFRQSRSVALNSNAAPA
jgi:protease PrsW